jgi:hypothetical protein
VPSSGAVLVTAANILPDYNLHEALTSYLLQLATAAGAALVAESGLGRTAGASDEPRAAGGPSSVPSAWRQPPGQCVASPEQGAL